MRALVLLAVISCAGTRPSAPSTLERAQGLMAHATVRAGDLALVCEPESAEVRVDGIPRGLCSDFDATHAGLALGAGMHRVELRHDGYWSQDSYYEPSGARVVMHVTLQRKGEDAPPAPGPSRTGEAPSGG